jgi:hypothetical protein
MRNGSRLQHYFAVKNEIFSSADRAFYKNAQIYTPVRCDKVRYGPVRYGVVDKFRAPTVF